jgi:hypothetical protein
VLINGSEAWTSTQTDEAQLCAFERKISLQRKIKNIAEWDTIKIRISFNGRLTLLQESKWQGCDGQGVSRERAEVKCRKGSWTASLREEEQWADPNFGGWMVLWKTYRKLEVKIWWTADRDRESWKKVLQEDEARSGLEG